MIESKVIAYYKFNEAQYDGSIDEIKDSCQEYHGKVSNGANIINDERLLGDRFLNSISGKDGNPTIRVANKSSLGAGLLINVNSRDLNNQWHCIFQKPNDFYLEIYRNKFVWRNYNGAVIYSKKKLKRDTSYFIYFQNFNGHMELFVDDILNSSSPSNLYNTNSDYAFLGRWDGEDEALHSVIDELFIVDEEPTRDEISAMYNNGAFRELDVSAFTDDNPQNVATPANARFEEIESNIVALGDFLDELMAHFTTMADSLTSLTEGTNILSTNVQGNTESIYNLSLLITALQEDDSNDEIDFTALQGLVDEINLRVTGNSESLFSLSTNVNSNTNEIVSINQQLENSLTQFSIQELFIELGSRLGSGADSNVITSSAIINTVDGITHIELTKDRNYDVYPSVLNNSRAEVRIENELLTGFDIVLYDNEAFTEDGVKLDCTSEAVTVNYLIVYK